MTRWARAATTCAEAAARTRANAWGWTARPPAARKHRHRRQADGNRFCRFDPRIGPSAHVPGPQHGWAIQRHSLMPSWLGSLKQCRQNELLMHPEQQVVLVIQHHRLSRRRGQNRASLPPKARRDVAHVPNRFRTSWSPQHSTCRIPSRSARGESDGSEIFWPCQIPFPKANEAIDGARGFYSTTTVRPEIQDFTIEKLINTPSGDRD